MDRLSESTEYIQESLETMLSDLRQVIDPESGKAIYNMSPTVFEMDSGSLGKKKNCLRKEMPKHSTYTALSHFQRPKFQLTSLSRETWIQLDSGKSQ